MFTVTIDWLSVTFKVITNEAKNFIRKYSSAMPITDEAPRLGYNAASRDANGVLCMWHTNREEMGNHYIFSGSALRNICSGDIHRALEITRDASNAGGHITRLDLAKDAYDEHVAVESVAKRMANGDFTGTSKTYSHVKSSDGGETLYIGSRQSERFIRMYLKGVEMGYADKDWVRLEIELKGMQARSAAWVIADKNCTLDELFSTILNEIVKIPKCGDWTKFIKSGAKVGLPKLERMTDREKWIEKQVTPAVTEHYQENPNSEAVSRLKAALLFIEAQRARDDEQ